MKPMGLCLNFQDTAKFQFLPPLLCDLKVPIETILGRYLFAIKILRLKRENMDFRITYPFFVRSFESVSGLLLSEGWELDRLIVDKYFWRMLL